MDPVIVALSAKVVSILTPFVARSGKELVEAVGEAGYERARRLVARLKERLAGDTGSQVVLEQYESQPEAFEPAVEAIVRRKLEEDPALREEVEEIVREMGPVLEIVQTMREAEGVTGLEAGELTGGKVTVRQEIERGKDVTGARMDRIG